MNHSKTIEIPCRLFFLARDEGGKPARLPLANGNVLLCFMSDDIKVVLTTGNGLIIREVRFSGVDCDGVLLALLQQTIRENTL